MLTKLKHALSSGRRRPADQATIDAVRQILERVAAEEEAALPHPELTANHILHLRVAIDRVALMELVPKHALAAEIGVAAGDFTVEILAHAAPRTLHLIDSWAHDERYLDLCDTVTARFAAEIERGQVVVERGHSLEVMAAFPDGYFDWVYPDTGHDFATTCQELEICRAKVKPGGIIAGHDYVTGHWLGWYRYGVIEAVHTFCVKYN